MLLEIWKLNERTKINQKLLKLALILLIALDIPKLLKNLIGFTKKKQTVLELG